MPEIATARTSFIFERNKLGQFAAACDKAAENTVRKSIELGARTSRSMAPAGKERWRYDRRPGYVPLKRSIKTRMTGKAKGEWYSIAPHAMFVEMGTSAHMIYGKLKFSWSDGFFVWNNPKFGPVSGGAGGPHSYISGKAYKNWDQGGAWVFHPGTRAQPFLKPAYEKVVKHQMMQIAQAEYPG